VPEVVNSVGMRLALIPPGTFWMGAPPEEIDSHEDESPVHEVEIVEPFYLGVFPVTQQEYKKVTRTNPSAFQPGSEHAARVAGMDTSRLPVEGLSWFDAQALCERLSARAAEKRAGRVYRLPTEAEWEYACRAGLSHTGPFHFGRVLSAHLANYDGEYPYEEEEEGPNLDRTAPVDAYPPNAFGLYDLHGNVSEWCADWFDAEYYLNSPRQSPTGPTEGTQRVLRGGCWRDWGEFCRAAFRYNMGPEESRDDFGVRVVMQWRSAKAPRKAPRKRTAPRTK
jgi:formylglycine-generating enzyme required for sulfatase activity